MAVLRPGSNPNVIVNAAFPYAHSFVHAVCLVSTTRGRGSLWWAEEEKGMASVPKGREEGRSDEEYPTTRTFRQQPAKKAPIRITEVQDRWARGDTICRKRGDPSLLAIDSWDYTDGNFGCFD